LAILLGKLRDLFFYHSQFARACGRGGDVGSWAAALATGLTDLSARFSLYEEYLASWPDAQAALAKKVPDKKRGDVHPITTHTSTRTHKRAERNMKAIAGGDMGWGSGTLHRADLRRKEETEPAQPAF
jgi:hypothetical protein